MITNDQIEEYLIHTELPFEQVNEGMWIIHDEHDFVDNIVVMHTPPVVTFRVKVLELAAVKGERRLELFERLLSYNATEMIAGAYGIEGDAIVIIDSLQSENLDFNEFQASLDAITMSLREHYKQLRELLPAAREQQDSGDLSVKELEAQLADPGRG